MPAPCPALATLLWTLDVTHFTDEEAEAQGRGGFGQVHRCGRCCRAPTLG